MCGDILPRWEFIHVQRCGSKLAQLSSEPLTIQLWPGHNPGTTHTWSRGYYVYKSVKHDAPFSFSLVFISLYLPTSSSGTNNIHQFAIFMSDCPLDYQVVYPSFTSLIFPAISLHLVQGFHGFFMGFPSSFPFFTKAPVIPGTSPSFQSSARASKPSCGCWQRLSSENLLQF